MVFGILHSHSFCFYFLFDILNKVLFDSFEALPNNPHPECLKDDFPPDRPAFRVRFSSIHFLHSEYLSLLHPFRIRTSIPFSKELVRKKKRAGSGPENAGIKQPVFQIRTRQIL